MICKGTWSKIFSSYGYIARSSLVLEQIHRQRQEIWTYPIKSSFNRTEICNSALSICPQLSVPALKEQGVKIGFYLSAFHQNQSSSGKSHVVRIVYPEQIQQFLFYIDECISIQCSLRICCQVIQIKYYIIVIKVYFSLNIMCICILFCRQSKIIWNLSTLCGMCCCYLVSCYYNREN